MSKSNRFTKRSANRHTFEKKKLAYAVSTVLASATFFGGSQALAQESGGQLEEVVVRGIRGSLQQSMDIKRDSAGVVDAISAEDIGKFPDTNLAESLQRITGVSIDRRNGEGYQVTVRGFGPQYNMVTLNGRTMPTGGLTLSKSGGSNPNASRSFDMSDIAAEGVSAVEVYKTGQANIASGGIGAVVNLKTRRPFDNEGFTATVGVKALHDSTVDVGKEITPEYNTFLSWSNDVFGASLAYTYQRRDSGQSGVFTNSWSDRSGAWDGTGNIGGAQIQGLTANNTFDDINIINEPTVGQQTNMLPGIRYYHEDHQRLRKNAQLTLQFRPVENLTATLDYTLAKQHLLLNGSELSYWFGGGTFPPSDIQFDGNPQVATPVYYWAEDPNGQVRDIGITQNRGDTENQLESTGVNVEWQASDTLSFALDYHTSEFSSLPGNDLGSYFNFALGAQGVWAQGYDNSHDLPLLVGVWNLDNRPNGTAADYPPGGYYPNQLDALDLGSTVRQSWYSREWNDIDQTRLDAKWQFSDSGSIDFGVESRSMEATQKASFGQDLLQGNWGVGTPGDVPPSMLHEINYAELFDGYTTTLDANAQAFFNQAGIKDGTPSGAQGQVFLTGWLANNVEDLGRYLSYNARLPFAHNPDDSTNRTIKEDVDAFYVQGSYTFDLGNMPLDILAGVRVEDTDVESRGQVAAAQIIWQGDNDLITQSGNVADAPIQIGHGSYSHTLPNLSLKLGLTEDMVARLAYSKTISRPSYNNQLYGISGVQGPNGGPTIAPFNNTPGTANNGNPNLKPLESDNLDISFEWYYGDSSYASIGYFQKDVPNFVGTAVENQVVPTTLDPTSGPRVQNAIAAINADPNITLTQQTLFQMVAAMSTEGQGCTTVYGDGEDINNSAHCGAAFDDPNFTYESVNGWESNVDLSAISSGPLADPAYTARVNFPVDTQSASLDGWELAWQHFLGDTGFGWQANYTIVDGDISYDITSDPNTTQFALLGLSDSANLVLIYEKYGWSARLAYNWRDKFLYSTTAAANEPGQTEAYSQIDLNVSYDVTDNLSVSLEGINLTGEDQRQYARTQRQLIQLSILGPRYALGARYTF